VNTFANNTNEFFTTTTTTPKIRVSTMSPQTGAANKFRSIGKPKFPYHRTPRILIEQREREREREKKNASLFSVQCRGHRSRAFAALIFFFSFQKSFSTKKEDKKSEENQPSGKISLSFSLPRINKRILSHANTPFANISIDSPFALLCGVLGVGVNLPAGDSSSDSSGRTSRFQYRYNSIRKCAGGRKPRNDHFGELSNPPLLLPLLFLLVMTLNSEAKYSSGGGGDPLGSSMLLFFSLFALLSQQKIKKSVSSFFKKKKRKFCLRVNISRELSRESEYRRCVTVVDIACFTKVFNSLLLRKAS